MKWLVDIVGVLLVLLGVWWILQGTNIVPVGFMAGHMQYALLGLVTAIIGGGLIVYINRRTRGRISSG